MGVELIYKHQQKTYELMKESLEQTGKAAYVFPVGCGKSFPVLKYMEENPDKRVLFVSPNLGIINQMKKYISRYILNGAECTKQSMPNFRAVTYQKISLTEEMTDVKPDIIVFDEIHRMGAEKWEEGIDRLIGDNPQAKIIGMSATPERTDKRNMAYERFGKEIIYEMSLTEALSGEKEGEVVLKGARYVRVLSQLREQIEGYKEQIELIEDTEKRGSLLKKYKKLESIISEAPEIEDIMEQAIEKKNGKYLVFCTEREEMYDLMERAKEIFGKVNGNLRIDYVISKEGEDGKTPKENRETIEEFEGREKGETLNLLFCVDMLNEGRHIEGIDGEIQFRPTESPIVYKQQMGRVLTADKEAEEPVIIDAVNNWLRQIDTYEELVRAIGKGIGKGKKGKSYDSLEFKGEESELLDILREIGEALRYNNRETYNKIIQWLEAHEGNMPRANIYRDGKQLSVEEMTEEEKEEKNLYGRWIYSPERKALEACAGIPIEEIPEKIPQYAEYIEQIKELRKYGLGLKVKREKTTYEEIIEWLEPHEGKMPRSSIFRDGKQLRIEEMTEEEQEEKNLYKRWCKSPERKALEACAGIPIEEIPEKIPQYADYIEQIKELRKYGLGLEVKRKKTTYEEIIEWLETHEGKMPSSAIFRDGKKLSSKEKTKEEKDEKNLYGRWLNALERKALEACAGIPIEEIPEKIPQYAEYIEQIEELRKYGLGLEVKRKKTTYEEIIEWLETHEGKMPRGSIYGNEKYLSTKEMTKEEQDERNLRARWGNSLERKALEACAGIPIEEIPEKIPQYAEYIEQIKVLREHGQTGETSTKKRMKKSVGKHVGDNEETRKELAKELEEKNTEKN